ncbi:hypothetical protein EYF80_042915 [Liparis tanakae]|uniref:Uncharacterized protein n=1 Tax=Liparis tanakae TaxID=230148 RepID=A0A4Z2G058_9TELE|nr:hypothetical protein EYF80_042915 [Liparis tanakae]
MKVDHARRILLTQRFDDRGVKSTDGSTTTDLSGQKNDDVSFDAVEVGSMEAGPCKPELSDRGLQDPSEWVVEL